MDTALIRRQCERKRKSGIRFESHRPDHLLNPEKTGEDQGQLLALARAEPGRQCSPRRTWPSTSASKSSACPSMTPSAKSSATDPPGRPLASYAYDASGRRGGTRRTRVTTAVWKQNAVISPWENQERPLTPGSFQVSTEARRERRCRRKDRCA